MDPDFGRHLETRDKLFLQDRVSRLGQLCIDQNIDMTAGVSGSKVWCLAVRVLRIFLKF
jgi:hypothetical protein